ncbi:MAG TPA: alternative ribosome rescue aminoacyl-tRNA hydrolase ArfB [Nitrospira sp.]|jgi:ribosome-associated protein|nr:alternative ribosome rescue aminoacyl-tRNA hydrolase ArfB [Nitrospira sp.]
MLSITSFVSIPDDEIELTAVRAQGAGGQHVNKVSSAIHLRFDIAASSLPPFYKERLLALRDHRITSEGIIILKAQDSRSQDRNRILALKRLRELIQTVAEPRALRRATKPTKGSNQRRLQSKTKRARLKSLRGRPSEE